MLMGLRKTLVPKAQLNIGRLEPYQAIEDDAPAYSDIIILTIYLLVSCTLQHQKATIFLTLFTLSSHCKCLTF